MGMMRKARSSPRFLAVLGLLAAVLAHVAVLTLPAAPVRAESDLEAEETNEDVNRAVKNLQNDERAKANAESRLQTLQQQHNDLQFRKRTVDPFVSKRTLRHDLRTNEAQQGWQKHESNRLDFESRQQQQNITNQLQNLQRR
jgi:hypothetical protein